MVTRDPALKCSSKIAKGVLTFFFALLFSCHCEIVGCLRNSFHSPVINNKRQEGFQVLRGPLRLRGGVFLHPLACFGGLAKAEETAGFSNSLENHKKQAELSTPLQTTIKEGWLLKRSHMIWPRWRRVYCTICSDGFLTYYKDGKRSRRRSCVPLEQGMLFSVGNEMHIRVSGQGITAAGFRETSFSGYAEYVFSASNDRDVEDWCAAIEEASTMFGRGHGLRDLDVKVGNHI
jgi:hypothetical protein